MKNLSLAILYTPEGGKPLRLIDAEAEKSLLMAVAEAAVNQAEERARQLSESDSVLGEVERAEVNRMKQILANILPELHLKTICRKAGAVM